MFWKLYIFTISTIYQNLSLIENDKAKVKLDNECICVVVDISLPNPLTNKPTRVGSSTTLSQHVLKTENISNLV